MSRKIIISKTALRDIDLGIGYYKTVEKGLGKQFEQVIHATLKKIQKFPFSASFAYDGVRYKVVDKFPYIVLYEFDNEAIYIFRVFNTHLSPDKI
jgi:plasmid stabilization system protein ParE